MQSLTGFYEQHFGFRYRDIDQSDFRPGNYWQWRDYEMPANLVSLVEFALEKKLLSSKTDAKRKLESGAIRIGLNDEKTPFKSCQKLKQDRPLEPNDFIRIGAKCLGIVPRKPTLWQDLQFMITGIWQVLKTGR